MTQQDSSIDTAAIRQEFNHQITDDLHSSAALAVFQNGEQIVDIVRGARSASPLFRVFSMGKPLAAAVLWRYKARGHFEWDTSVAEFWPEFGTHGKSDVTIKHVLSHSAGLASSDSIPPEDYGDWGRGFPRGCMVLSNQVGLNQDWQSTKLCRPWTCICKIPQNMQQQQAFSAVNACSLA